jgi:hypothetical protein
MKKYVEELAGTRGGGGLDLRDPSKWTNEQKLAFAKGPAKSPLVTAAEGVAIVSGALVGGLAVMEAELTAAQLELLAEVAMTAVDVVSQYINPRPPTHDDLGAHWDQVRQEEVQRDGEGRSGGNKYNWHIPKGRR